MSILTLVLLLIVPFLYTVASLVDKIQLRGDLEDSEPGVLVSLGSVFGLLFMIPIGLFIFVTGRSLGGLENLIPLFFNEIIYVVAIWLFMAAMKNDDASKVVPWFQTIPAFGLIGAFIIIGEKINTVNILAIVLLMIGGFVLSYHKDGINKRLMGLMILSAGLFALYDVIFANFGREIDSVSAIFINISGKTFWSGLILIGKKERRGFIVGLRTRLKLQSVAEITTLAADIALCALLLYFPVSLVQGVGCVQPLFILVGAALLTKFYPKVIVEDIQGLTLVQKIAGITLMVIGGIILSI